jgi:ADP-heptose:LPS heptosyltransferase
LLAIPGVAFISLQRPVLPENVAAMRGADVLDLSSDLTDFGETAAVLANLDLTISIDSAVAHLAGALGRTVWLLLSRPSDWRWFRDREDSPWYPTMRLFRQAVIGEWAEPMSRAAAALGRFVADRGAAQVVPLHASPAEPERD